jgi:outer membrane protein assembly factor BamB/tetratricopeptide (TPR) repeat protein
MAGEHRRLELSRLRWNWGAGVAIGALAVFSFTAGDLFAQQPPLRFRPRPQANGDPNEDQTADGVFHSPEARDIQKQLKKAKQLLRDGRYAEGLPLLDDILEKSQDYFDSVEQNQVARNGLKSEAQRLIGEQPADGLKSYETLFGAKAERMLADALTAGDMTAVAEVARRYFHTRAGYEATLLIGRHQLDHNEPLAAALCFQRLSNSPAAEKYEPTLSVMLAACWLRGGMDERSRQVMTDLKKRDPDATIRLAGKEVKLFAGVDEAHAMSWLIENFGSQKGAAAIDAANWAMFRGNPARNATSAGGMPLLNPRWRAQIAPNRDAEKAVASARQEGLDRSMPMIPVMQPLAVADWVMMRTPSGLIGLDFNSGKRVWEIHSPVETASETLPSNGFVRFNGALIKVQGLNLTDRLWENATYGTISSDGEYVFQLEEVTEPPMIREMPGRAMWRRGQPVTFDTPTNELAAYELRTQGKIKWRVGGKKKDFDVEPQLTEAYFLGPPLPLMGRLYVLAEMKGEIRLVALDAKTGKLDWSQQLASPEDTNVIGNEYRRTTGVSPSYADGILTCPTSAGAVVAVDIANRALVWGYEYPHTQQVPAPGMMVARGGMVVNSFSNQSYMGDRWSDASATVADGSVILTPIESDQLFCLSLLDGKLLWKMDRGDNVYVAGVQGGNVLLVGRKQVQAYKLDDGKPAWSNPLLLPQGSMPSGRGFISGDRLYLPLSSAEVASVDVAAGTIVARAKSRKGIIPGNLICYKGSVISQGVDSLDRFFQIEPLQKEVTAALAANPNDPVALANQGNIELDEGKVSDAIGHISKSYSTSALPSTRELLVEALLADLGRDFASARGTVGELEKLVVLDGERTSFLRLLAQGLGQSGDHLGALDAYLRLIDLPGGQSEPEVVSSVLSVRRDRWIRARAAELYAEVTSEERAKFDAAVTERLGKALAAKQPKDLRRFIAYFGFHPTADEAREQLYAQLTQSETALERELLLEDLERSNVAARRRAAVAQMAMFLNDAGKYDEAAIYYHRLESEFPDVVCLSGKTGKQLVESLPADSPMRRAVAQSSPWPEGAVRREGSEIRIMRSTPQQRPFALNWRGSRPAIFDTVSVAFDQQQQMVVGRDGIGHDRFRLSINESGQNNRLGFQPISPELNFATAQGHLLVVNLGNQVLALDTLRPQGSGSRTLWQQELVELTPNLFNGQPLQPKEIRLPWGASRHVPQVGQGGASLGVVGPLLNRCIFVARGRDLTAFDPLTGEVLWSRRGIEPGSELFGDDEAIVVAPPDNMKDGKALILRSTDGEQLATRTIAKADHRWAYCGRRCLSVRVENGRFTFLLNDPWKEKDLVLGTFEAGVKPALVGDEIVAFFEPKGRFLMVALEDGRKLVDTKLDAEPKLDTIAIERSPQQYLLFVNHASAPQLDPSQPLSQALMGAGGGLTPASGHIYAFDRETLKPSWPAPATVENYYVLVNQGLDLPVIVLLRLQGRRTPGGAETKPAILCLDRRNGRALLDPAEQDLNQPNNFFSCELSGDRDRKTVTIAMPSQPITLRFTNDPIAPQPPYQVGLMVEGSIFGRNSESAVLRAIHPGAREPGNLPQGEDPFK